MQLHVLHIECSIIILLAGYHAFICTCIVVHYVIRADSNAACVSTEACTYMYTHVYIVHVQCLDLLFSKFACTHVVSGLWSISRQVSCSAVHTLLYVHV